MSNIGEINRARSKKLAEIIKPLEKWINEECSPHDILIVTQGSAQLFSGELSIKLDVLD